MNEVLRAELLQLASEDQATVTTLHVLLDNDDIVRRELEQRLGWHSAERPKPLSLIEWDPPSAPREVLQLVSENRRATSRIRAIVDEHGWPGRDMVGDDGAKAAWLLVMHADTECAFRHRCLDLLGRAVELNDADAWQLAKLRERVLATEGLA